MNVIMQIAPDAGARASRLHDLPLGSWCGRSWGTSTGESTSQCSPVRAALLNSHWIRG